jgi:hypothetical protein
VVARFTDTSRTICDVVWSLGVGEGGWLEAIVLESAAVGETFQAAMGARLDDAMTSIPGIVGLHLLKGHAAAGQGDTVEKKLPGVPDKDGRLDRAGRSRRAGVAAGVSVADRH